MTKGKVNNWTQEELKAAFDRVCDSRDWKNPISAIVNAEDKALISDAIEFFTATKAEFRDVVNNDAKLFVQSVGYRMGPAGDF